MSSGQGATSTTRGLTVLFFYGVVRGVVRNGPFLVRERLILLVATLAENWLWVSICCGDSPVEGKLIFSFVFGSVLALPTNPDNVTTGIFFLGLVNAILPLNLLFRGVMTLGDWVVAGLLTPRIEPIDVLVLFTFLRFRFLGLILLCVKSMSPTLSVIFLEFDGFFIWIVCESFGY